MQTMADETTTPQTLADAAQTPRPGRSIARQLAERAPAIEQARANGWRWSDLVSVLQRDGVKVRDAPTLRSAWVRACRLIESGQVVPGQVVPSQPAGGSTRTKRSRSKSVEDEFESF